MNNDQYRDQRKKPKVIIPNSHHNDGEDILLENAPLAHEAVTFAQRDAEYSSISESRAALQRGVAMQARITTNPYTKVIPKTMAP
jgi:hypothetical protein